MHRVRDEVHKDTDAERFSARRERTLVGTPRSVKAFMRGRFMQFALLSVHKLGHNNSGNSLLKHERYTCFSGVHCFYFLLKKLSE